METLTKSPRPSTDPARKLDSSISEAASESARRGRPPAFSDFHRNTLCGVAGHTNVCRRSQVNYCYLIRAIGVLGGKFPWLWNKERQSWKAGILAELGRIQSPSMLLEASGIVCKEQPKTKDAIRYLRAMRLAKTQEDVERAAVRLVMGLGAGRPTQ